MVYRSAPTEFGANPLASDDPYLRRTTATEFGASPTGLDLSRAPSTPLGLQGMPPMGVDPQLQQMASAALTRPVPAQTTPRGPQVFYSPSTGEVVANGFRFSQRNASEALRSIEAMSQPAQQFTLPDTATDWQELPFEEYTQYIDSIRNPSTSRRMGEAWEHAWRGVGDTFLGAGLAGAEAVGVEWDWAQRARNDLVREYEENAPFMMQLRDVENVNDAATWASQMLIQGVPWLVETVAVMAAGALVGGVVGGGVGAAPGAGQALVAREAVRRAAMGALRNRLGAGAAAYQRTLVEEGLTAATRQQVMANAARAGASSADDVADINRFFDFAERANAAARGARVGAVGTMGASNYAMGVGDIRNSIVDAGGDPTTADAIANIWGWAIPYALVESAGDLLLTAPLTRTMPELFNSRSLARNVGMGMALNAPSEGAQELAQYGITESVSSRIAGTTPNFEPIDLLEVGLGGALAGAGVGGITGALGTDFSRRPAAATPTTPVTPEPDAPIGPYDGVPDLGVTAPEYDGVSPGVTIGDLSRVDEAVPRAPGTEPIVPGGLMNVPYAGVMPPSQDGAYIPENYPEYPTQGGMEPAISEATGARQRSVEDIYRDVQVGLPVPRQEAEFLYGVVTNHLRTNPTDINAIKVRDQLRSQLANDPQYPTQPQRPATPLDIAEQALARNEELQRQSRRIGIRQPGSDQLPQPTPRDAAQPTRAGPLPPTITNQNPEIANNGAAVDRSKLKAPVDLVRDPATGQMRPATPEELARLKPTSTPKADKLKKGKKKNARQRAKGRAERAAEKPEQLGVLGRNNDRDAAQAAIEATERMLREQEASKAGPKKTIDPENDYSVEVIQPFDKDDYAAADEFFGEGYAEDNFVNPDAQNLYDDGREMFDRGETAQQSSTAIKMIQVSASMGYEPAAKRLGPKAEPKAEPQPEPKKIGGSSPIRQYLRGERGGTMEDAVREQFPIKDKESIDTKPAKAEKLKKPKKDDGVQRNPDQPNRLKRLAQEAKEAQNAIPKRGPEAVAPKEQPRTVQKDGGRDTAGEGASSARSDKARDEGVQGPKVDQARIDKATKALLFIGKKEGRSYYGARQKASGVLSNLKRKIRAGAKNPLPAPEQTWVWANGADAPLSVDELIALIQQMDEAMRLDPDLAGKERATAKLSKMGKAVRDFAAEIDAQWKASKNVVTGTKEGFRQWVRDNIEAANLWLGTDHAAEEVPGRGPARFEVANVIKSMPKAPDIQQAMPSGRKRFDQLQFELFEADPKDVTDAQIAEYNELRKLYSPNSFALTREFLEAMNEQIPELEEEEAGFRNEFSYEGFYDTFFAREIAKRADPTKPPTQQEMKKADAEATRLAIQALEAMGKDDIQQAGVNPGVELRRQKFMQAFKTVIDPTAKMYKDKKPRLPGNWRERVMEASGGFFTSPAEVGTTFGVVSTMDNELGRELRAHPAAQPILNEKARAMLLRDTANNPQQAFRIKGERGNITGPTVDRIKDIISKVQKRIHPGYRFSSVHVFENAEDLLKRAPEEIMIAPNGAKVTLLRYLQGSIERMKLIDPKLRESSDIDLIIAYVESQMLGRAAVHGQNKALFVMRQQIESEREFLQTLEHEYIVHMGVKAIFPNEQERIAFLERVGRLPGVRERVKQLVAMYPVYGFTPYYNQVEELLAYQSELGPLALETLLSAKEGIDPNTKRTLWEDFKQLVKDWVALAFAGFRDPPDASLDRIVNALREHAIVGRGPDMNALLDELEAPNPALTAIASTPDFQQAMASNAPQETAELLYGTNTDNPGRAYSPKEIPDVISDMRSTIAGPGSAVEKLKTLAAKAGGTTLREKSRALLREIETLGNMEMRSVLVEKMMDIMHRTIEAARKIMSTIQETRKYAINDSRLDFLRKLWGDNAPGSSPAQRKAYGKLAIAATLSKLPQITEQIVRAAPRLLVRMPNGLYTINYDVFDGGKALDFQGGLLRQGTFTKQDFLDGIEQFIVDEDGNKHSRGVVKLDQETVDLGYDIYVAESRHMARGILTVLEHQIIALNQMNDAAVQQLIAANDIPADKQEFMNEALTRMYKLYADIAFYKHDTKTKKQRHRQKEMARQVLAELMRVMHEEQKLNDWTDPKRTRAEDKGKNPRKQDAFKWRELADPHEDVKPFVSQLSWFLDPKENRLEQLHGVGVSAPRQYAMLGAFQSQLNSEVEALEFENQVIQSILGNYVEMTRKGKWRVAVQVLNADGKDKGKPADIPSDLYATLPVVYPGNEKEARELHKELQAELDGTYKVLNAEGDEINVAFDVSVAMAPGTRTLTEAPNIRQFLDVAKIIGLNLGPQQMKQIANLIENASSRKRYGLMRAGTPGMDASILENNSATLTRYAWWAAKTSQAWNLNSVFEDRRNRKGDWGHLENLQRDFDIANRGAPEGQPVPAGFVRSEQLVYHTEAKLLRYANQLRHMADYTTSRPTVPIRTTAGERQLKIESEAEAHLVHAQALIQSLEKGDLEVNLNDLLSKTGPLRMMAVFLQLGSIASGIMNLFSVITHVPWYLMSAHKRTGFGEGMSFSNVVTEIWRAFGEVGLKLTMSDSAVVKQMLEKAKKEGTAGGLTVDELEFLYEQTVDGLLMPQQTYSLTGGTQSNIRSVLARNVVDAFLSPFALLEASNRRVTALVTYRLSKDKLDAAKIASEALEHALSSPIDVQDELDAAAKRTVFRTQGDYTNINRSRAFRGDYSQFALMYKMFPLMTQQLIYNMPTKQQLAMLGMLFLLGGLKGEPFADDIMDIYDTLLQKLGVRHDSVELQITQALEEIMPGLSKWVMYGAIDTIAFGGTMSTRISMGDIIPMTGAFREGADVNREIINAFGPAYAANVAALEYAWLLTDFTMQAMGLRPQVNSWEDLVRRNPQAQLRGAGEAALMLAEGQITDRDGRLISDDVHAGAIFARFLGFYPLEATRANTAVRLDRMHTNYMRTIRARYVLAYANAYRQNDNDRMRRIEQEVNNWNASARETGQDDMLITNFRTAAIRAGRAASSTTIERTSDGAPNYSVIDEIAAALEADVESED